MTKKYSLQFLVIDICLVRSYVFLCIMVSWICYTCVSLDVLFVFTSVVFSCAHVLFVLLCIVVSYTTWLSETGRVSYKKHLHFATTWVHTRCLIRSVLLVFIALSSSCVLCARCCQYLDCSFLITPSVFSNVYLEQA
jgi:hypothetical protein